MSRSGAPEMIGRAVEQAEIAQLLASVRGGIAAALVLHGDAGVGKSSLLADATEHAGDFAIVRFVAVESEMHLGFAALHALLAPFLDDLDALPAPQQHALNAAVGRSSDDGPDPFLVGLATLTLLSGAASRQPLLLVVDDAQWVDEESANVIGFVARRLFADRVGTLIAMRPGDATGRFDDLPRVAVRPLSDEASRDLLAVASASPLGVPVTDRIVAEASGNPLALVELARSLSADQRAGLAALPEPFQIDRRLEERFLQQVRDLPADSQRLLLAVAAEPTGNISLVLRAGEVLGFDERAIETTAAADLLTIGSTIGFRHSVIRSAVYQGADRPDRRRTHAALANATDADRDPDRRAWHRAAATAVPDEEVAAELERAAGRAQNQGGYAATAALLERAADLTPDRDRRAVRRLLTAVAALTAGNSTHAHRTVTSAIQHLDDPILRAQARRVQAAAQFFEILPEAKAGRASASRHKEIMTTIIDTATTLAPLDVHLARETIQDAFPMAAYFGRFTEHTPRATAQIALSLPLPADVEPTTADLVLDALSAQFVHGSGAAVPELRMCLEALRADPSLRDRPRTMALGCWVGFVLGDAESVRSLAHDLLTTSRENGAFQILPEMLCYLGQCELMMGRLTSADAFFAEQREIEGLSGRPVVAEAAQLIVAAWRGREEVVRSTAPVLAERMAGLKSGLLFDWVHYALVILDLSVGDYEAAARIEFAAPGGEVGFDPYRASDEIEAHVRGGDPVVAQARLAWLSDRALANQSPLELGLLARGRALVEPHETEPRFQESLTHLAASGSALHLARTQLLYGEWLRRQNRRRDARSQLEAALDAFEAAGADGFAGRARSELLATGAQARTRVDNTRSDLTPQEEQIAKLAAAGATNAEIAGRLFISANTVDYHLRKVYRKLNVSSRRQLVPLI